MLLYIAPLSVDPNSYIRLGKLSLMLVELRAYMYNYDFSASWTQWLYPFN